ncbi:hypothetical protein ACHHYP_02394 [Achlya hypogyna]|uniref:Uncharacterized protein n=1 Tax=Achlya hypogyna TaxID=1202772 RepID=A0A1V9Z6R6_ACHHY|nr:hypothetical protein ACHHYP_02394 [Achlya hypogyna]
MAQSDGQLAVWRITDEPLYAEKDANTATWWKRRRAWFVLAGLVLVTVGVVTAIAVSASTTDSSQGSGNAPPSITPFPSSSAPASHPSKGASGSGSGLAPVPEVTTVAPVPNASTNETTLAPEEIDENDGNDTSTPSPLQRNATDAKCAVAATKCLHCATQPNLLPEPEPPSKLIPLTTANYEPTPDACSNPRDSKASTTAIADPIAPDPAAFPPADPKRTSFTEPSATQPCPGVRLANNCGKPIEIMYTLRVGAQLSTYYHTMQDKQTFDVMGHTFHGGTFRVGRSEEATLFECSRDGGKFWYDLSVVTPNCQNGNSWDECQKSGKKGYNVPMKVEPQKLANNHLYNCGMVECNNPKCPDAYLYPFDDAKKMRDCHSDEGLLVTICY